MNSLVEAWSLARERAMKALVVRLTAKQCRQLERVRESSVSMRTGRRAMCLLLSAQGEPTGEIARLTGLSRKAVANIKNRWNSRGMRSLEDARRSGRPPRINAEYRRELKRALTRGPLSYGYVQTVWSIARLRAHLEKTTGVRFSSDWLRRLVHQAGYSCGRPAHTLSGKRCRRDYQKAKKRLGRLKKGLFYLKRTTNCGSRMKASSICIPTWPAAG
jgi:transposase